jgi:ABC-type multidrug transport system ATPase subunit
MISISGLTKTFGDTTVLAGVDFSIARGESVAVVGPAASGRTTLLRILATLVPPSSGRVEISGLDVVGAVYRVRRLVAYSGAGPVPGNRLRVIEYLRLIAGARRQPLSAANVAADLVGLNAVTPIETLTGALRQRLPVAAALAAAADVILLDDAFHALDAPARTRVAEWLNDAREQGTTIVVSANDGDDVSDVCQRTVHLDAGRIVEGPSGAPSHRPGLPSELVVA